MSNDTNDIVVGIDFGTTYSGVSWAVNAGARNIRLINTWPDPANSLSDQAKVPSVLSYNENGEVDKWGYTVSSSDNSLKWLKLLLPGAHQYSNDFAPVKRSNTVLKTLNRTAQEVITDYLRCLWQKTAGEIKKVKGEDFEKIYELSLVLTVPAMWSDAAKDATRKAAAAAGLPGSLELVTEPEAAARHVLKEKEEENELKVGDAFVVCDAGGGTVDLISYRIEGLGPLRIRECAVGTGGLCGAAFIDSGFEKHISVLVGQEKYNKLESSKIRKMLQEFETVKRSFGNVPSGKYSVDLKGIEDDPKNGIEDGTISMETNGLRAIFDHVCSQVLRLVEDQIQEVKENNLNVPVKAILLVGGFGSSSYLFDRLEAANKSSGIMVLRTPGAWTAVCKGATLWGLENINRQKMDIGSTVTSRLARYSYGISVMYPFDPSQHLQSDKIWSASEGKWLADNQMRWLLKWGEVIEDGKVLRAPVFTNIHAGLLDSFRLIVGARTFGGNLLYCDARKPPTRKDSNVKSLCFLTCQMPGLKLWLEPSFKSPKTQGKWRKVNYEYLITLGSTMLSFKMQYKNEITGEVVAKYAEDK